MKFRTNDKGKHFPIKAPEGIKAFDVAAQKHVEMKEGKLEQYPNGMFAWVGINPNTGNRIVRFIGLKKPKQN